MIIVLRTGAQSEEISEVCERIRSLGCLPVTTEAGERSTILVESISGPEVRESLKRLRSLAAVEQLVLLDPPYEKIIRLGASKGFEVDRTPFGTGTVTLMAGPCTVESEEQIFTTAEAVAKAGAQFLRGGALGWGMPAAVGFSLGLGRQPVVSLVGDGAAMYSPQALWTAAHEDLPVTFVVINNRELVEPASDE